MHSKISLHTCLLLFLVCVHFGAAAGEERKGLIINILIIMCFW